MSGAGTVRCLVPVHSGFDRLKSGQVIDLDADFDSARLSWDPSDETEILKFDDHLMHCGRRDSEKSPEVCLGRR